MNWARLVSSNMQRTNWNKLQHKLQLETYLLLQLLTVLLLLLLFTTNC